MSIRTPKISSRKKEHVDIAIGRNVHFRGKMTGFERWEFVHNALPEIDFADISTETSFLSKTLAMPFLISAMTGGYADAKRINRILAEVCEECRVAMGVGSQRQALQNPSFHSSFSVARKAAPTIPIIGNIGAAEVGKMKGPDSLHKLIDLIEADAIAIHLNPLQEFLQPEGNPEFSGVLESIERLCKTVHVPVIVKEIGAGISRTVAERLINAGVTIIDVAGAGGTSWAGVEILRRRKSSLSEFWDWGIPTAKALCDVVPLRAEHPTLRIIASGGMTHGLDAAKAYALGADMIGSARPVLKELFSGGHNGVKNYIEEWQRSFRGAMFLTGCRTLTDLRRAAIRQGNG